MVVPVPLETERWYELEVEVNGNDTTAYVDGEEIMTFSHEQLQENQIFDKGAVGIRIWNSHAMFDDFELNGPGIKLSGQALSPMGTLATTWGQVKF